MSEKSAGASAAMQLVNDKMPNPITVGNIFMSIGNFVQARNSLHGVLDAERHDQGHLR